MKLQANADRLYEDKCISIHMLQAENGIQDIVHEGSYKLNFRTPECATKHLATVEWEERVVLGEGEIILCGIENTTKNG